MSATPAVNFKDKLPFKVRLIHPMTEINLMINETIKTMANQLNKHVISNTVDQMCHK